MKPEKDFFDKEAFELGEFERLQALMDGSVRDFAEHLHNPVGNILRREMSESIAGDWVEKALALLKPYTEGESARLTQEAQALIQELQRTISEKISDSEIEDEIESCVRALSQSVLGRWYSVLLNALEGAEEVPSALSCFLLGIRFRRP